MKIAVLILAHKNIWQLEKLVERLRRDFDVYIHADQKWNLDLDLFKKYPNVFFVKRYSVNWGSYSQIMATLVLFKTAYLKNYQYYMLISGQDIPIKCNSFIKTFLEQNQYANFVNNEALPKKEWAGQNGGYDRLNYYFGNDFGQNLLGAIKRRSLYFMQDVQKKLNIRRKLYPIKYFGGWNWVNLNSEAMNYIMTFLKEQPAFLKTFKYTYCADEIWLQTILLNSSVNVNNNNLRYTDWEPHAANPKTLLKEDLDKIKASDDLFARKFDETIDKDVINSLYEITKE